MTNTVRVPPQSRLRTLCPLRTHAPAAGLAWPVEDSVQSLLERPMRMGEVVPRDLRDGRPYAGAGGIAMLARQVPAYWPMLPLMAIPAVRRAIERDVAGTCDNACTL